MIAGIAERAFQLPVDDGECFCVYRAPDDRPCVAAILHLPALGDEMNKSRAMTARAARAFAARGCGVLQVDWIGCGDSAGDHADASLARWAGNARCALDWLHHETGRPATTWLWALRAGALLVPAILQNDMAHASLLLWQPVVSGALHLTQLLRLKLAGTLNDSGEGRSSTRALRERLRSGETLDVGGYSISPRLADELEAASFEVMHGYQGCVVWLEVTASASPLSPAAVAKIDTLRAAGIDVAASVVAGPGFWQSVEIQRCDALIDASAAALAPDGIDALPRDAVIL